ncbi:MAG: PDZ domain-containing protein [Planctomycetales bacterium]|nr:PDZ domain-containing protein [Planctomycetales bacterium]
MSTRNWILTAVSPCMAMALMMATAAAQDGRRSTDSSPDRATNNQQDSDANNSDAAENRENARDDSTNRSEERDSSASSEDGQRNNRQPNNRQGDDSRRNHETPREDEGRSDTTRENTTRDNQDQDQIDRRGNRSEIGVTFLQTPDQLTVNRVANNSLAAQAGLQRGDQVLRVGGRQISDRNEFLRHLGTQPAGTRIPIVVLRDNEQHTLYLTMNRGNEENRGNADQRNMAQGRRGDDFNPPPAPNFFDEERGWLGVFLNPRIPDAAIVESVQVGSAADDAGLQQGDMIAAVNGQRIYSAGHLSHVIGNMQPGEEVDIQVVRRIEKSMNATLGERPTRQGRFRYEEDSDRRRDQRTSELPRQPNSGEQPRFFESDNE